MGKKRSLKETTTAAYQTRSKKSRAPSRAYDYILTDIEGTTTSISFVRDVLFPYILSHLDKYLRDHWHEEQLQQDVALLMQQAREDLQMMLPGAVAIPERRQKTDAGDDTICREALAASVRWQMQANRKTASLKTLQGHMWRDGYESGAIKGHLFSDVAAELRLWQAQGIHVYVYSSGSVLAQQLLFGNSEAGNLCPLLDGHFDTTSGMKVEAESYRNILAALPKNTLANRVVFLTDIFEEAQAAHAMGMRAVLLVRPGNAPLPPVASDNKHLTRVNSFQEVSKKILFPK